MRRVLTSLLLSFVLLQAEILIEPIPESIAIDSRKVALGKKLFFDPILSGDGTISCASCHDLQHGGDDGRARSFGIGGKRGSISSPTVYNSVFNFRQFWDGRARNLAEQAYGPIENPVEMGNTMERAVASLKRRGDYVALFGEIYPDGISGENLTDAIAEFEKALITPDSPFDRYLKGEKHAIDAEAKRGYGLFVSKGCVICHHGVNIGGNLYNKFGIYQDLNSSSRGRYDVTKRKEDMDLFKVPSLRNIALTAPYMHDGRAATLRKAVELMSLYQLGRYISPSEIDAITAFLETLTAPIPALAKQP